MPIIKSTKKTKEFEILLGEFLVAIIFGAIGTALGFILIKAFHLTNTFMGLDLLKIEDLHMPGTIFALIGESLGAIIGVFFVSKLIESKGHFMKGLIIAVVMGIGSIYLIRVFGSNLFLLPFILTAFGATFGYNHGD
ncbi:hypothetical protein KKC94_00745 [Patescibacteria group bacterium]|nr:hypothetical protein [Patescibacteria group bacterium]